MCPCSVIREAFYEILPKTFGKLIIQRLLVAFLRIECKYNFKLLFSCRWQNEKFRIFNLSVLVSFARLPATKRNKNKNRNGMTYELRVTFDVVTTRLMVSDESLEGKETINIQKSHYCVLHQHTFKQRPYLATAQRPAATTDVRGVLTVRELLLGFSKNL